MMRKYGQRIIQPFHATEQIESIQRHIWHLSHKAQ